MNENSRSYFENMPLRLVVDNNMQEEEIALTWSQTSQKFILKLSASKLATLTTGFLKQNGMRDWAKFRLSSTVETDKTGL